MYRRLICFTAWLLFPCLAESATWAQFGGSRAGAESNSGAVLGLPMLDRAVAESFIATEFTRF